MSVCLSVRLSVHLSVCLSRSKFLLRASVHVDGALKCTLTHAHTHTHPRTHTNSHMHTHTHTHTRTHTHSHMHTHTHTHTHTVPRVTFRSTEVRVREDQEFFTVQLMLDGFLDIEQSIEVFIRSRDGTAIGEWNQTQSYTGSHRVVPVLLTPHAHTHTHTHTHSWRRL